MDREALQKQLMATFTVELDEHLGSMGRALLAFEREPDRADRGELVATLFRSAHSLKGAASAVGAGGVEVICHRLEDALGRARDGRLTLDAEVLQALLTDLDRLGDAGKELHAEAAPGRPSSPPPPVARSPRVAETVAEDPPRPLAVRFARVSSERLDVLLDRGGELLVACRRIADRVDDVAALHASLARLRRDLARRPVGADAERWRDLEREAERLVAAVAADSKLLQQVARPLEEGIRRVRMIPFEEVCDGLERAVRDLSRPLGKEVELVVEGAQVELDRPVLDQIKDPLLHLVRNAVDHGLETPPERLRAGKHQRGRITVRASLRGGMVLVEVADDGRGLDLSAIRAAARRLGLPQADDARDAARLVFAPGLSTSTAVTEVSGRGVGLDVVKSRLEALHGSVELSSDPGRGTRFSLTMPLTLTMTRVLLCRAAGQAFAFVGASVRRVERVEVDRIRSVDGREVLLGARAPVPVMSLADALGAKEHPAERADGKLHLVVIAAHDGEAAFVVDELLAEQDVVIKGLGRRVRRLRHFGGATVLSTGEIALALSAADLVRTALGGGPRRALSAARAEPAPARRRLLVVDDSVTTRALVKSVLEDEGYEVVAAADGVEALQVLEARGADLVVSDVEMPRLDGFGLTSSIRASKRFRHVPVVLVTALASDADRARGVVAGASAYLVKSSFDQRGLLGIIHQLL